MLAIPDVLVTPSWLEAQLGHPSLRVVDATTFLDAKSDGSPGYVPRSGKTEFREKHPPGAAHLDLVEELSDRTSPFPFTMLPPERFAAVVGGRGIGSSDAVVVYASDSPMWATRLWWMFHSMGFENVAVLDGGLERWCAEGRPTATDEASWPGTTFESRPIPERWAERAEVRRAADRVDGVCLLDALGPKEYAGERAPYGRAGHIPGSRNVPYRVLTDRETGCFRDLAALRELVRSSGALEHERVICYCGGGIASTMLAFTLHRLGHRNVAVYDGSMLEWCADPSAPLRMGSRP